MRTTRRRLRAVTTALALPILLASLTGLAACGDEPEAAADGVASLDGDDGGESDDSGDGGGAAEGERPMDDPEAQDAMLEYAECMRDHGIDMPDPEFSEDGGVSIRVGPGGGAPGEGPDEEEFAAAEEACQPIIEDVMPEREMDPEQQAEMQDHLVEVAECMREKGYDMPDPEVDENGRVRMRSGPGAGGIGGGPGDEQFEDDMEDCGGGPGGAVSAGGGDDSGDDDSDDEGDGDEGDEVEA